jgi:hypothetical protein
VAFSSASKQMFAQYLKRGHIQYSPQYKLGVEILIARTLFRRTIPASGLRCCQCRKILNKRKETTCFKQDASVSDIGHQCAPLREPTPHQPVAPAIRWQWYELSDFTSDTANAHRLGHYGIRGDNFHRFVSIANITANGTICFPREGSKSKKKTTDSLHLVTTTQGVVCSWSISPYHTYFLQRSALHCICCTASIYIEHVN